MSSVIALSVIAAEAILCSYLGKRALPVPLHGAVVSKVKARLIQGEVPVLDRSLCEFIESECIQLCLLKSAGD